jgi:hypothetical protein
LTIRFIRKVIMIEEVLFYAVVCVSFVSAVIDEKKDIAVQVVEPVAAGLGAVEAGGGGGGDPYAVVRDDDFITAGLLQSKPVRLVSSCCSQVPQPPEPLGAFVETRTHHHSDTHSHRILMIGMMA